jgi:hypothetical protein
VSEQERVRESNGLLVPTERQIESMEEKVRCLIHMRATCFPIENCAVEANINVSATIVGGIVGTMTGGSIYRSYAKGSIMGSAFYSMTIASNNRLGVRDIAHLVWGKKGPDLRDRIISHRGGPFLCTRLPGRSNASGESP